LAFDLLQTPFDLEPGKDKDNDGIPDQYEQDSAYYWNNVPQYKWDVDMDNVPDWRDPSENPQHGMTAFKRFTLNFEPNKDNERYLTMAGYNFQTGAYEPYDTAAAQPDDQRFLMSSGPFDLMADSSVHFIFAIILADWDQQAGSPTNAIAGVDKAAQDHYDMFWVRYYGVQEHAEKHGNTGFTIVPNPAVTTAQVLFTTTRSGLVSLTVYNSIGQVVMCTGEENLPAGAHVVDIDMRRLSQGTYFMVVNTAQGRMMRSLVVIR
jgi:hypothetical protein